MGIQIIGQLLVLEQNTNTAAAAAGGAPGFSHSYSGQPDPTSGHMVSRKGSELTLDHPPTEADLAQYVATHGKHLKSKDHYLGYWNAGDGRHVLDVSRNIADNEEAHDFARRNKQEAIYNSPHTEDDPTPVTDCAEHTLRVATRRTSDAVQP